jgi:hypothetical protein
MALSDVRIGSDLSAGFCSFRPRREDYQAGADRLGGMAGRGFSASRVEIRCIASAIPAANLSGCMPVARAVRTSRSISSSRLGRYNFVQQYRGGFATGVERRRRPHTHIARQRLEGHRSGRCNL